MMKSLSIWWNRHVCDRVLIVPTFFGMQGQFNPQPRWIPRAGALAYLRDNRFYWKLA